MKESLVMLLSLLFVAAVFAFGVSMFVASFMEVAP